MEKSQGGQIIVEVAQEKKPVLPAATGAASAAPADSGTNELLAKHGAVKKVETRGRHPKDCKCGNCVGSRTNGAEAPAAPARTLNPTLVKKTVSTSAEAADKIFTRRFYRRGLEVLGQGETNLLISDATILPEEKDLWGDLSADLAKELELDGRYAAGFLLCISVGAYLARWKKAFDRLDEIEKKMTAEKSPEKKDNAPVRS